VTRLRAGRPGFDSRKEQGLFSLTYRTHTGSGAQPAFYTLGTGVLSLGIKRPGRKSDHSPPPTGEIKNAWSYTSTPQTRLPGVVLSYARDKFTLIIIIIIIIIIILSGRKRRRLSEDRDKNKPDDVDWTGLS
jgi:hypothetical protein